MRRYTVTVDGTAFTIDVNETAADRFEVSVGDRTFEARLEAEEDLPGAAISPEMLVTDDTRAGAAVRHDARRSAPPPGPGTADPAASGPAPRTALPARPAASAAAGTARSAGGTPAPGSGSAGAAPSGRPEVLSAPMPGVVLEVHVRTGDVVRRGDPILVLEAMKMRNTIRAPRPGTVVEVAVEAGQPVGPGEPLVRLAPGPG